MVVCCVLRTRASAADHQFVLESGVHDRPQARVPVRTDKGDDGPVVKFRVERGGSRFFSRSKWFEAASRQRYGLVVGMK
jgi:hypothetical protein